jgi:hypothetical protein
MISNNASIEQIFFVIWFDTARELGSPCMFLSFGEPQSKHFRDDPLLPLSSIEVRSYKEY